MPNHPSTAVFRPAALLCAVVLFLQTPVFSTQFYVSPAGQPSGDGSITAPWDLQTALNHPAAVQPGDTIWLRGGTYFGNSAPDNVAGFISYLKGTEQNPIIVRQYPGERAILDGGNRPHPVPYPPAPDSYCFGVLGEYAWYWGFEVTDSNPHSRSDSLSGFRWRVNSVISQGQGNRFINLVVHDNGNGLTPFSGCVACEFYGNIIFYNGWSHLGVRGHGEGMYGQNVAPTKYIRDNIVFKQFDSGIILYGSSGATIDNFHLEGNVLFANGAVNDDPNGWGFLLGKNSQASGPGNNFLIQNNYLYNRFDYLRSNNIDMGYQSGLNNVTFRNNYSAGRWSVRNNLPVTGLSATGNTLVGEIYPVSAAQISADSNTILPPSAPPAQNAVFLRPNLYEPGRAHIVVYNWLNQPSVSVDLAGAGLSFGDTYEVVDVQNLFSAPVVTGTYNAAATEVVLPLTLTEVTPMTGTNVPRPPVHTNPVFNVFLLRKAASAVPTTEPAEISFTHRFDAARGQLCLQTTFADTWCARLSDLAGKALAEQKFNGMEGRLDLGRLPSGLYVLTLSNGQARGSKKLWIGY